jgi:hypothetical protein
MRSRDHLRELWRGGEAASREYLPPIRCAANHWSVDFFEHGVWAAGEKRAEAASGVNGAPTGSGEGGRSLRRMREQKVVFKKKNVVTF